MAFNSYDCIVFTIHHWEDICIFLVNNCIILTTIYRKDVQSHALEKTCKVLC